MDHLLEAPEKIHDPAELFHQIKECLSYHDRKGLKIFILEHRLSDQTLFFDVASEITKYLTQDNFDNDTEFFRTCETCLHYVIRNGKPKELLVALLENCEFPNDDSNTKFKSLLIALQKTLLRLPGNYALSVDFVLETVAGHIHELDVPGEHNLEGEERKLLEADPIVIRTTDALLAFIDFLEPFVWDVSARNSENKRWEMPTLVEILSMRIIHLFNHPLVHLDLCWDSKIDTAKSDSRLCAEKLISFITDLYSDLSKFFLDVILSNEKISREERNVNQEKEDASNDDRNGGCSSALKKKIPNLALACLLYLVYKESIGINGVPWIYAHQYIFEFNLPYICILLKHSSFLVIFKGIHLTLSFLNKIEIASLPGSALDNNTYMELFSAVIPIILYCPIDEYRKLSVTLFSAMIKIFDDVGRYRLFQFIFNTCENAGILGFTIQLLKNQIDENLHKSVPHALFVGSNLERQLCLATILPSGATTDLLQQSDQIFAALNLIRYLLIRDPPERNLTGVWDMLEELDVHFMTPLRTGLQMSIAHYRLELDNVKTGEQQRTQTSNDVSISVGGQMLPAMPKDQQEQILANALNSFDLMESLLSRIGELITQGNTANFSTHSAAGLTDFT